MQNENKLFYNPIYGAYRTIQLLSIYILPSTGYMETSGKFNQKARGLEV